MRETLLTAAGHRTAKAAVVDEGVVVQEYRSRSLARRARLQELRAAAGGAPRPAGAPARLAS